MSIANLITRTFTGAAAAAVLAFGFSAGAAAADKVIRIGVTPVPHADIVNFIKPQLEKEGVKLEVVEFNDYIQPNLALDSKDLDANYFQTIPYLEEFVKQHNFKFKILVSVHLEPMAVYRRSLRTWPISQPALVLPCRPTRPMKAARSRFLKTLASSS